MSIQQEGKEKVAVIGGGSFGTALASLAAHDGRRVEVYVLEDEVVESINNNHVNNLFLPDVKLTENIVAKKLDSLHDSDAKYFIWSIPSQFTRKVANTYQKVLAGKHIMLATKGIEVETGELMIHVISSEVKANYAILSGPSFAKEVALKKPTLVTVSAKKIEDAVWWQNTLSCEYFRVYTSTDIIGLEVGGSIKNVLAIATGISDGLGMDNNTRAAIIARGLIEMTRFGIAYGAKPETFVGLSGMGDLVLTATGAQSRNYSVGKLLAEGMKIEEIKSSMKMIAEGVPTAKAIYLAAESKGIDMPICREVYKIIYENKNPKDSVHDLMNRPLQEEKPW